MNYTPEFSLTEKDVDMLEKYYKKTIDDISDKEVSEFHDYLNDKENENRISTLREGK